MEKLGNDQRQLEGSKGVLPPPISGAAILKLLVISEKVSRPSHDRRTQ